MITRGVYDNDLLSRGMFGREEVVEIGRYTLLRDAVVESDPGYLLSVTVLRAVDTDREIFAHRMSPGTVGQAPCELFSHVASPTDLERYPIGEPVIGIAYYRLATVQLIFRSLPLLRESWLALGRDIQGLAESLDQLEVVEQV